MDKIMYFAHPMNVYSTTLESKLLSIISERFPDYKIENPNQPKHKEGCEEYRRIFKNPMLYFYTQVLPKMDAGIFLPFPDGKFGAGVFGEARYMESESKPLYEITFDGKISEMKIDKNKALSIKDTRKRISASYI
jgi:hypothetical protein